MKRKDKKNKNDKNREITYISPVQINDNMEEINGNNNAETNNKKEKKYSYFKFIIKILSATILIVFAIIMLIKSDDAQFSILLITGIAVLILALIRIFTLVLKTNYKKTRILSLIEIFVHSIIGIYLICAAYSFIEDPTSDFSNFNVKYYHYFLAVILYSRALIYFWTTILYREPTKNNQFWTHIVCMTLGCIIAGLNDFTPKQIAYTLAILALVCAVVIGVENGAGFYRYRKKGSITIEKQKIDKKKDEKELPGEGKKPYKDPNLNDDKSDLPSDVV